MNYGPTQIQCPSFAPLEKRRCLVNDLSGHTDCCGSDWQLFHLGSLVYNSLLSALAACTLPSLVVSVYTLRLETTVYNFFVWQTSMYVQAYLELSLREVSCVCCSFLGSCNWEPGRGVPGSRGGLRPGCCCLFLLVVFYEASY